MNQEKDPLINDFSKMIIISDNYDLIIYTYYFRKSKDYTELIKHIINCVNKILLIKKENNMKQIMNVYIDLSETKIKNLDLEFIKMLIQFLSDNYEDNLEKMYFRNAKIMFKTIYKLIRPFIPKDTRKKIFFEKKNKDCVSHISECDYEDL